MGNRIKTVSCRVKSTEHHVLSKEKDVFIAGEALIEAELGTGNDDDELAACAAALEMPDFDSSNVFQVQQLLRKMAKRELDLQLKAQRKTYRI
jgi:hypothetical protein